MVETKISNIDEGTRFTYNGKEHYLLPDNYCEPGSRVAVTFGEQGELIIVSFLNSDRVNIG